MRTSQMISIIDGDRFLLFRIREMGALKLESWLLRAGKLLGEAKGGEDAFVAARILFEEGPFRLYLADTAKDGTLMEEMLACCSLIDDDGQEIRLSTANINTYVTELRTLLRLRREVLLCNLRFYPEGARKPLDLPRERAFRKVMEARTYARPVNVPGIAAAIITQRMTSLADLEKTYSFMDALDMLEVCNVRNYNKWARQEGVNRGR